MNESNTSLAKKQLAHDLGIIFRVQVVGLCAFGVGLFFFGSKIVPNYPEWDNIHLLCGGLVIFGVVVLLVTTFWGFYKLTNTAFSLPILIRVYLGSFWGFILLFVLSLPFPAPIYIPILLYIFPFYSVVPQFFIARWLAKEAKNGTL
jgi:hypothetical protein